MRISEGGFLKAVLFASAVFGVGPHDDNYLFVEIIQFELCYHDDERHPPVVQGVISQDDK